MIYTTLKANKEQGIDIVQWYDETISQLGWIFKEDYNKTYYDYEEISWEQIHEDFSEKEIRSRVWKEIKQEAKTGMLVKIDKMFVEVDALFDIVHLCRKGLLKRSDLVEIKRKVSKREDSDSLLYDYYHPEDNECFYNIDNVMDAYFPCEFDYDEDTCTNCGNCA